MQEYSLYSTCWYWLIKQWKIYLLSVEGYTGILKGYLANLGTDFVGYIVHMVLESLYTFIAWRIGISLLLTTAKKYILEYALQNVTIFIRPN